MAYNDIELDGLIKPDEQKPSILGLCHGGKRCAEIHYSIITDHFAMVCGRELSHVEVGAGLLVELYRAHVADWPKFFKMDTLSKVGYLAQELLLKECDPTVAEREEYSSSRAVVLFGTTASLCADRNYEQTIQDEANYYPSPALFVYTLPNIVTGEIAIRNHYRGETSFYVLERFDAETMAFHIGCAFQDSVTESVLAGWVESSDNNNFHTFFTLVERAQAADLKQLERTLAAIMEQLRSGGHYAAKGGGLAGLI